MVVDIVSPPQEDFEWVTTDEPHATRRKIMLTKDYAPQLRRIMGHDWTLSYWVGSLVLIQLTVAWIMRSADLGPLLLAAYCIGGTCNHSLALAMHELSHNLAFGFKHVAANRCLAWLANLPIGVPAASSFKKYHLDHHKYQGNILLDADLPTRFEARLFKTTVGKVIWLLLQPFFYSLRPLIACPKAVTRHEIFNFFVQMTFNFLICYFISWKCIAYFIGGTFFGYGIHPISGHFISEHYMFVKGIETYSYYGPLNWLTYNVGYHNEHHDFPNVPGRLLPAVTKTAPEFYENLPSYRSWSKVLFDFATDPHVSIYCRIKRLPKETGGVDNNSTANIQNDNDPLATPSSLSSPSSASSSPSPSPVLRVVKSADPNAFVDDDDDSAFVIRHRREED